MAWMKMDYNLKKLRPKVFKFFPRALKKIDIYSCSSIVGSKQIPLWVGAGVGMFVSVQ